MVVPDTYVTNLETPWNKYGTCWKWSGKENMKAAEQTLVVHFISGKTSQWVKWIAVKSPSVKYESWRVTAMTCFSTKSRGDCNESSKTLACWSPKYEKRVISFRKRKCGMSMSAGDPVNHPYTDTTKSTSISGWISLFKETVSSNHLM